MRRSVVLTFAATLVAMILAAPAASWIWPADGQVVRAFSLGDDPYAGGQHRGVDIAADPGSNVRAPAAGTVSFAGTVPGNGRTVTIRTADGYAVTLVGLGSIAVAKNAVVSEGETVGTIAPAPDDGTPASVHLGVRVASDPNGYIDPLTLLPGRTQQPIADDQVTDGETPIATTESSPATSDGAQSSDEAAETSAAGGTGIDVASEVGVAVAAPIEIVSPVSAPEDESSTASGNRASASDGHADGAVASSSSQTEAAVVQSPENATSAQADATDDTATAAQSRATAAADVSSATVAQTEIEALQPSTAVPTESSSSGAGTAPAGAAWSASIETRRTGAAHAGAGTIQLEHRRGVRANVSKPALASARSQATAHSRSTGSRWIVPVALLLLALGTTGGSAVIAVRAHSSRRPPRMMLSPGVDAAGDGRERDSEEDSGCSGLAVCQRTAPYWARRRVRRPIRHFRSLSAAQGQRRADGERYRRARDAGHGRGRERRALIS